MLNDGMQVRAIDESAYSYSGGAATIKRHTLQSGCFRSVQVLGHDVVRAFLLVTLSLRRSDLTASQCSGNAVMLTTGSVQLLLCCYIDEVHVHLGSKRHCSRFALRTRTQRTRDLSTVSCCALLSFASPKIFSSHGITHLTSSQAGADVLMGTTRGSDTDYVSLCTGCNSSEECEGQHY